MIDAKNTLRPLIKRTVITLGLEVLAAIRAEKIFPSCAGRGMVFTLHHVRPYKKRDYDPNALLSVTPEFLTEVIEEALALGYEPAALSQLPHLIKTADPSRRFIAFTLDDGWKDNLIHAAPVFRKYNVPYTLFITQGYIERTHCPWWETVEALTRQVKVLEFDFGNGKETLACTTSRQKLAAALKIADFIEAIDEAEAVQRLDKVARAAGIDPIAIVESEIVNSEQLSDINNDPLAELGAHTISHRNLARLSPDALAEEIQASSDALQAWTGIKPEVLAYPYGWKRAGGRREANEAASQGFKLAVTTQPDVLKNSDDNDWFLLPRVSLNGLYQRRRYVRALLSGVAFRFL